MRGMFNRQRPDAEPFRIMVDAAPRREDLRRLEEGLDGHAVAQAGVAPPKSVAIYIRDEGDHIVGGLSGVDWGGSFHIHLLWVHEDYRGEGYGRRLVEAAEQEAESRGARHVTLTTYSYQAPGFYARLGYEQFAVLDDIPLGHRTHYFLKHLPESNSGAGAHADAQG